MFFYVYFSCFKVYCGACSAYVVIVMGALQMCIDDDDDDDGDDDDDDDEFELLSAERSNRSP